ncbi:MAG TPA: YdeI/OmpD-associated family protein [Candidatus Saccharimonadales bacterium]
MATKISGGTFHRMPADLHKALTNDPRVLPLWEDITPLARNEFICWVENAKHTETRERRVRRTCEELLEGKRRPCCWLGCIHRTDKAVSPSVQGILAKRARKS